MPLRRQVRVAFAGTFRDLDPNDGKPRMMERVLSPTLADQWFDAQAAALRTRSRVDRVVATRWGLGAACLLSLIALGVLHWLNRGAGVETWAVGNASLGIGLGLTGALITSRLPRNPLGWFFLVGGIAEALCGATREWTVFGAATHPDSVAGIAWSAWASGWLQQVGLATLPLVLLHFPDGGLVSQRWRPVRWLTLAVMGAAMVTSAVQPGSFTPDLPEVTNPLGIPGFPTDITWPVVSVLTIVAMVLSASSLVIRWRGSDGHVRQQIRWVTVTGLLLATEVAYELTPFGDDRIERYAAPLALLLFIGTIGYAVLRHHLWDLDVLVNLSLVYLLLTVLTVAIFVAAVTLAGAAIDGQPVVWPSIVALGVVAVVFAPLRHGVQSVADRLLYGQRRDPHRALARLSRRVAVAQPTDHVLDDAVDAIAAAFLRLDHVAIRTPTSIASRGSIRTDIVRLPLVFHGVDVGALEVAPRPGAPLKGRGLAAMSEVADQLAPIVHGLTVTEAVNRMRRELVTAREEERRRLRRDIHDGLGPALAAVALQVEGAAALIDSQPDTAKGLLIKLSVEVSHIVEDVRRLVHELQPPVLDALGLAGAVRQQVLAFAGVGLTPSQDVPHLDVVVDAPESLGDLPAAVEVTAYRIVGEALANVSRHAHATHAVIVLQRTIDGLDLSVDDDGQGMPVEAGFGVGTLSMIERATALGGECALAPSPLGGVRVRAILPLSCVPTGGEATDDRAR